MRDDQLSPTKLQLGGPILKGTMNTVARRASEIASRKSGLRRRIRVLFRLAIRKLLRIELVKTNSSGNPKANPIRWIV